MAEANFTLDPAMVQSLINQAVHDNVLSSIEKMSMDPVWLQKVENMINQAMVQETISRIGSIDINSIIAERIDEALKNFRKGFVGINDQSSQIQFTIMDDTTVVENVLTTKDLNVVESATINNLAVLGSINTDNEAWNTLANNISEKTLAILNETWREQLVQDLSKQISANGIDFSDVKVNSKPLISGNTLGDSILESSLQSVGTLHNLTVDGNTILNQTVYVNLKRVGVNTVSPEAALSVWDEEVSINIGKYKNKQAFIGTGRDQGLSLGVNRIPQIDISADGLTTIKKLRVGIHTISHAPDVPGWSGTRGDIVFNSNPKDNRVFAWVCVGGFAWQVLKSAE